MGARILAAAVALAAVSCTACKLTADFVRLDDHRTFANRVIDASHAPSLLRPSYARPDLVSHLEVPDGSGRVVRLDEYLDDTRTAAFVVLRDDRIVYERYSRGFDERSLFNSFSIAKSIMSTLVGIAIAEGRIPSLDARVQDFRAELADTPYGPVPLRRLLTMTSGVTHGPALWEQVRYYFGSDLLSAAASGRRDADSAGWRYSEADIQVLGLVLAAAVGKPISTYLSEKLWKPLGMEAPALWALDHDGGHEKAFCCISARARDFARFGLLHLNGGRWQGRQLVPEKWVARAVLPGNRTPDGYVHQHLWWVPGDGAGDYYAYGHKGQYVYVNAKARAVVVKLSETADQNPLPMFRALAAAVGHVNP